MKENYQTAFLTVTERLLGPMGISTKVTSSKGREMDLVKE